MAKTKSIFIGTIIFCFSLCGCFAKQEIQYVDRPIYVEVPIVQTIEIEPIRKPIYYIKNISDTSTDNEIAEAYVNTIKELNAYIKKLEMVVEPLYKKVK